GGTMDLVQAGKRTLIRLPLLLCAGAAQGALGSSTAVHPIHIGLTTMSPGTSELWSDLLGLVTFIYVISFIVTTARRSLPLHDRWAGTEAVHPAAAASR